MFKVLIVDDEPIIRKGLSNVIDWRSVKCEICGEAGDGIEGMEMIREMKPDIVITDIKMPGIDGLKMISETREIIPGGKIIVLTGFRDFEYLQEAIKLGAFDYLLKPAKIDDITSIIKRAVSEIEAHMEKENEIKNLKIEFEKKIPLLRQKLLYDVMFKILYKKEDIMEQLELYCLEIEEFILMIVETDESDGENGRSQYENQLYQFGIINVFEDNFKEDFTVYYIPLNNRKVVFIVQTRPSRSDFEEIVYKNINNLQDIICSCFGLTVTVSVSTLGSGIMSLSEKAMEAEQAMEYKFYMGKNSVILYKDIKSFYRTMDFSMLENHQKALIQSVRAGNEKNTNTALEEIRHYINEASTDSDSIKMFYWNLVSSICSIPLPEKIKSDTYTGEVLTADIYKALEKCTTIGGLNSILEKICLDTSSRINYFNHKTINSTLRRAIDYINSRYSESITLNDAAEYAFVSTYYLSRMFTKELEKNFVDYLNEVRIERAKGFLRSTDYKTYKIAEMVGIRDAHYFSKLFKKYTGITPSEYRDTSL